MRLSASIILLRKQKQQPLAAATTSCFKMLFVQRSQSISSPGMYAFPGGVYEKLSDASCLKTTALRELFEETGILFGLSKNNDSHKQLNHETIQKERQSLRNNDIQFDNFLEKYSINIEAQKEHMKHFSTFITPEFASPKYITPFFLFDISDDELCCDYMEADLTETAGLKWLTPADAIALNDAKVIKYLPPQAYAIHILNKFDSIEAAMNSINYGHPTPTTRNAVTVDNVFDIRDDRGVRPIKPFKLPSTTSRHLSSDSISDNSRQNTFVLAFPGDEEHDEYPSDTGARHRLLCQQPMGHGFSLQTNILF